MHNIPPSTFRSSGRNSERTTLWLSMRSRCYQHHYPDRRTISYDETRREGRELTLPRPICGNFCHASSVPSILCRDLAVPFRSLFPPVRFRNSEGEFPKESVPRLLSVISPHPRLFLSVSFFICLSRQEPQIPQTRRDCICRIRYTCAISESRPLPSRPALLDEPCRPFRSLLIVRQKLSFMAVIERN